MTPFLTFYTPTYRRPKGLAACLASVQNQTAVDAIEQIVIPDHVGLGIGGMFQRIREYASAVHGSYVHVLADDDVLASPTVVEQVRAFAEEKGNPAVILVMVRKASYVIPQWPPVSGGIDLGNMIVRSDVWRYHVGDYGDCYEGDYAFAAELAKKPYRVERLDLYFLAGAVMHGAAEEAA